MTRYARHINLRNSTHVRIFERSQLEGPYIGDSLYLGKGSFIDAIK